MAFLSNMYYSDKFEELLFCAQIDYEVGYIWFILFMCVNTVRKHVNTGNHKTAGDPINRFIKPHQKRNLTDTWDKYMR